MISNQIIDDDFDDFKSAPSPTTSPPPMMAKPVQAVSLMDMLNSTPAAPVAPTPFASTMGMGMGMAQAPPRTNMTSAPPMMYAQQPMAPNYMAGGGMGMFNAAPAAPSSVVRATSSGSAPKPASSANFDDLWSMSFGAPAKPAATNTNSAAGKSIKDLEREKAQAGIWGGGAKPPGVAPAPAQGGFGNFGSMSGGGDDLLL